MKDEEDGDKSEEGKWKPGCPMLFNAPSVV